MRKGRLFICSIFVLICVAESSLAELTIAHKGTPNATLLYKGKPMLKVGPLPEVAVFAVGLGSVSFDVEEWLDWMARYGMGYGRVYPESSYEPWQALEISPQVIADAPVKYRRALQSPKEIVIYLHTDGFAKTVKAGKYLKLQNLAAKSGPASIDLVHPYTGKSSGSRALVRSGKLSIELPEFYEDIAIRIVFVKAD